MCTMITFTGTTCAAFVENGVFAVITFTGMMTVAFAENGVYDCSIHNL